MITIIGAGLTGLSTARHLVPGTKYALYEQQDAIGGLCRSPSVDGFTFDYTGHLLHLRNSYTQEIIGKLLRGKLCKIQRNAAIYCKGRYLPFPFQANLHGLPQDVLMDCLEGFIRAQQKKRSNPGKATFHGWVRETFGPGIARHFFLPYNEKLFCRNLRQITCEWTNWAVPRPSLREVLQGALGIVNADMGYNASFWYPERGGIQVLPEAFGRTLHAIELGRRLIAIRPDQRMLAFHDGTEQPYERLVSTLPLPGLLRLINRLPERFTAAPRRLASSTVHNINIGINRAGASPYHWIYFPEPEFPFYRVGFYSNFTAHMAPRHTSSLYIEMASRPGKAAEYSQLRSLALDGLIRCGILRTRDRIVAEQYNRIDSGYVVFDRYRQQHLRGILAWLKKSGILSAGRYGAWTYCSMEDNILQGRALAEALA